MTTVLYDYICYGLSVVVVLSPMRLLNGVPESVGRRKTAIVGARSGFGDGTHTPDDGDGGGTGTGVKKRPPFFSIPVCCY